MRLRVHFILIIFLILKQSQRHHFAHSKYIYVNWHVHFNAISETQRTVTETEREIKSLAMNMHFFILFHSWARREKNELNIIKSFQANLYESKLTAQWSVMAFYNSISKSSKKLSKIHKHFTTCSNRKRSPISSLFTHL